MRLAETAERYGDQLTISWRSFLLRPEPEARTLEAFTKYTTSWERPAGMEPRAPFATPWSGEHAPPSHSFPSSLAGKVAETFGAEAFEAFAMALFRAYFVEHRTISDRDVLADVAAAAGLDRTEFGRRWADNETELTKAVWRDYATAVQSGINGVPAVVVDRQWLVPGAVDVDDYGRVIAKALEARAGTEDSGG